MLVGELIDLLEPFRGRGEDVTTVSDYDEIYRIVGVHWDDTVHTVVIDLEFVG